MSKRETLGKSFKYAAEGFKIAAKQEPNFRIHLSFTFTAIIAGFIFKLDRLEWVILIFAIAFVMILELINTTLEALVDVVQPDYHEKARIAKDVSAAAVLLGAITSLVTGSIIFLPKIVDLFIHLSEKGQY